MTCVDCDHAMVHHDGEKCWAWVEYKRPPHGCRCTAKARPIIASQRSQSAALNQSSQKASQPPPSAWWGIEHVCGGEQRAYPVLHWADEPDTGAGPRRAFHCDACGRCYAFYEEPTA